MAGAIFAVACGGERSGQGASAGGDTASGASAPGGSTASPATASAAGADGAALYQQRCASCHLADGTGVPGTYPPLAGSEFVTGPAGVPIRIVMHGLQGEITVGGTTYNGLMPAWGVGIAMSDEELAALLTYVRTSWGNQAPAVTPAEVAQVRAATEGRTTPWTAAELQALQ